MNRMYKGYVFNRLDEHTYRASKNGRVIIGEYPEILYVIDEREKGHDET